MGNGKKEDDIVVVDNGQVYESEESTLTAKQYAEQAKLEADRSEKNANLAEEAIQITADYRDEAKREADRAAEIVSHIIPNALPVGMIFQDGFAYAKDGQAFLGSGKLPASAFAGLKEEILLNRVEPSKGIHNVTFETFEQMLLDFQGNCPSIGYDEVTDQIWIPILQDGVVLAQALSQTEAYKWYGDQMQGHRIGYVSDDLIGQGGTVDKGTPLSTNTVKNTVGLTVSGHVNTAFVWFDKNSSIKAGDRPLGFVSDGVNGTPRIGSETRNKQARYRFKIQLSNVGVPATESNANELLAGLINKAHKDFSNTDMNDYIVEQWVSIDKLNFYHIYKSGRVEQGGQSADLQNRLVNLFVPMEASTYTVVATPFMAGNYNWGVTDRPNWTSTYFKVYASASGSVIWNWRAIGFKKGV